MKRSYLFHPSRKFRRNEADDIPWAKKPRHVDHIEDVDPWAVKAWRMWHQKEPREVIPTQFTFPEKMMPVGLAKKILYRSDKWEEDNDFYTYYHNFDSYPLVYTTKNSPLAKGLVARRNEQIDVADFLGIEHVNAEFSLPLLAKTMQLIVVDENGKERSKNFRPEPPLCCTADLKTLVILVEGAPIIIHGGRMVVTERGIVR